MSDIFLSYAREELERVRPLIQALEAQGWEVWRDEKIPTGRRYDQVIATALGEARCVLVIWSQASVNSDWVPDEAARGRTRGVLIPAQIDDIELPLGFGMYQTAKLMGWNGDTADPEFRKITEEVTRLIGAPAQMEQTVPPVEEPHIEEQQADDSIDTPQVPKPEPARQKTTGRGVWLAVVVGVIAVGFYVFWQLQKPQVVFNNSIGMEFVRIEAGTFRMGWDAPEAFSDEQPVRWVHIRQPFDLSKYEVTQAQWKAVMVGEKNPSHFQGDNLPVESVSWDKVREFIRKLNEKEKTDAYHLPTEAEWEYAARAGTQTAYHFGNDASQLGEYAWYDDNSESKTHVANSVAGQSALGKAPSATAPLPYHGILAACAL